MSWAGINNENEFYSEHYLAEVFSGDVKVLLQRWLAAENAAKDGAATDAKTHSAHTPYRQLGALSRPFQQMEREFVRARSAHERLLLQRPWLQQLANTFALPWQPEVRALDDDLLLPLLGELTDAQGNALLWLLEALPAEAIDADPLSLNVDAVQLSGDAESKAATDSAGESDIPLPKGMQNTIWQSLLASDIYTRDDSAALDHAGVRPFSGCCWIGQSLRRTACCALTGRKFLAGAIPIP